MLFQNDSPFAGCLMSDTTGFTYTGGCKVNRLPLNTEYTSTDSPRSYFICICFLMGPEWICMTKTRLQWHKGSPETVTVSLLKRQIKKKLTFLLPVGNG